MATWGGSTPCQLDEDEDGYPSEMGAEEEEEEEEEEDEEEVGGAESSSSDDVHIYSNSWNQRSHSTRKNMTRLELTAHLTVCTWSHHQRSPLGFLTRLMMPKQPLIQYFTLSISPSPSSSPLSVSPAT